MTDARPATIEQAAQVLRDANARGERVTPVGGGTHRAFARPPERIDVLLDTTGLRSVVRFEPEDMTISVQAGMTASELTALLAERGCRLPLDVEQPDRATLGGMTAVAWAGPRCFGLGTLRDLLIGARAVLADGTIVKTGGMVVKNVSGYDLTKLLHGSLGSLGVIVELNFKVLPQPARQVALAIALLSGADALRAACELVSSRLPYCALDAASDGTLAIGCEGHPRDVERLRAFALDATARLGGARSEEREGPEATADAWAARLASPFGGSTASVWIGAPRSSIGLVADEAEAAARAEGFDPVWRADAGRGLVELSVGVDEGSIDPLVRLERTLAERFDSVRVARCPQAAERHLMFFGRRPRGLALMRALKDQFDPNGVLNVGANVGGI
jgi:glycolate dehydrogenase FAD-binding subunit